MKSRMHFASAILFVASLFSASTSFGYEFDSSLDKKIAAQVKADLDFMNSLSGSKVTPLHQQIFGSMDGKGYKNWFESRVTLIGFNACGGGNAVACVIPWLGSSKIWVTNNYIKFSHPQISRMMVVYHEARHTEVKAGNWSHATCPEPFKNEKGEDMKSIWTGAPLAGEPACDETPFGSYGSSTILLKNVSKFCENCSEKVRMDAGIYSDDQMGRIIDAGAKTQMQKDFAYGT